MKMLDFPEALEAAGVTVRVLDGWDDIDPAGYVWRESDGNPAGAMHHHTATTSYVPNTTKANAYAGMSKHGSERLYQEDYGDSEPVYTIANAYPAPISSGAGDRAVLVKVRAGIEVVGRQGSDTPGWYGNTHYWNTEWILDGTGSPIEQAVWDMMVRVCFTQNVLMGWGPNMHIAHGHHTRRKIDLWGGQFSDSNRDGFDKTLEALRTAMEAEMDYRGVLNVPDKDWARKVVDWAIDTSKLINPDDNFVDDWERDEMTDGRYWTFMKRFDNYLKRS